MSSENRAKAFSDIMAAIRAYNEANPDDVGFVTDLQEEIEKIPGAEVSFVSRDLTWLKEHSYLEDRPVMRDAELQAMIFEASLQEVEGYAIQDAITTVMDEVLDGAAPRAEDGPEPS